MCASFEMSGITTYSVVADMMDLLGVLWQPTMIYQKSQSMCCHHIAIACSGSATDFSTESHHTITSIVEWLTKVPTTCGGIFGDLAVIEIHVDPAIYHP
jgi:hypothetical protein